MRGAAPTKVIVTGGYAAVAMDVAPSPTPMRASFIIWNMARIPLFSSPSSMPRQLPLPPSVKEQVELP